MTIYFRKYIIKAVKAIVLNTKKSIQFNTEEIKMAEMTKKALNKIKAAAFTEAATAEKLFYADRQTKTLEFVGRM